MMVSKGRFKTRVLCVLAFAFLLFPFGRCFAAEGVRKLFTSELSRALLGTEDIYVAGADGGWIGVILAAPGTSLAPVNEAYGSFNDDLIRYLTYTTTFDRPVRLQNGYAVLGPENLADIWKDYLARSVPSNLPSVTTVLSASADSPVSWLFQQPDEIDRARGVALLREPSPFVLKYREYKALYGMLEGTAASDSWRLNPRLSSYGSRDEAKQDVAADWIRFGFKSEVEIALKSFDSLSHAPEWAALLRAQSMLQASTVPLNPNVSLAQSFLFPPPGSWPNVGSWMRLESVAGGGVPITFQLERVRILRPWMDLAALLGHRLPFDRSKPANADYFLSDGAAPTFDGLPSGRASTLVEELLLVREIHPQGKSSAVPISDHPLSVFASPDSINLLGYVVRVLPKLPE